MHSENSTSAYEKQISELLIDICKEHDEEKRKVLESHLETIRKLCPKCNESPKNWRNWSDYT